MLALVCGSSIEIDIITGFVKCPHCGQYVFFDTHDVILCHALLGRLKEEEACEIARKYLLKKEIEINLTAPILYDLPFWSIETKDKRIIEPASSSVSAFLFFPNLSLTETRLIEEEDMHSFIQPDISLKSIIKEDKIKGAILVYLPFYQFSFTIQEKDYSIFIDASSGNLYINQEPISKKSDYLSRLRHFFVGLILISLLVFTLWEYFLPSSFIH